MEAKKDKKLKISKNQLIVLIVGIFVGIIVGATAVNFGGIASEDNAVDYVNENFLVPQGLTGAVIATENKDGFTEVTLELKDSEGSTVQEAPIYVSRSGRYILLGQLVDLKETVDESSYEAQDIPKTETPEVQLYVMSFCPYGSQAEQLMQPVVDLLKEYVTIEPKFIVNVDGDTVGSLHGEIEANEDLRQICVWKYYQDKWWDYVDYVNTKCSINDIETCWKKAADSVTLDKAKIETCFKTEAIELVKEHVELTEKYGVQGSPTILINGVKYQGSRGANAFKEAICSAFEDAPDACDEEIEEVAANPSGSC